MKYAYVKAETDQSYQKQTSQLKEYVAQHALTIDHWFENASGSDNNEYFAQVMQSLKPNDTLLLTDLEHIDDDSAKVSEIYCRLIDSKVNVVVLNFPHLNVNVEDSNSAIRYNQYKNDLLDVYYASIQNQRRKISDSTREALSALKENGVQLGRPQRYDHEEIMKMYLAGSTYREISSKHGLSHAMISKIVKKHGIIRRKPNGKAKEES